MPDPGIETFCSRSIDGGALACPSQRGPRSHSLCDFAIPQSIEPLVGSGEFGAGACALKSKVNQDNRSQGNLDQTGRTGKHDRLLHLNVAYLASRRAAVATT